jgi:hypothetical protein
VVFRGGSSPGLPRLSLEHAHDIFISYSRRDEAFAAALERALEGYKPSHELNLKRLSVSRDRSHFTRIVQLARAGQLRHELLVARDPNHLHPDDNNGQQRS